MRGHQALIDMRLQGVVPICGVEIETDAQSSGWPEQWPRLHGMLGVHSPCAYVHIAPEDGLRGLDLRFTKGILVRVEGMSSKRVREVFTAVRNAGASRVIGTVFLPKGAGETETLEVMDSAGVLTWPQ